MVVSLRVGKAFFPLYIFIFLNNIFKYKNSHLAPIFWPALYKLSSFYICTSIWIVKNVYGTNIEGFSWGWKKIERTAVDKGYKGMNEIGLKMKKIERLFTNES